MDRILIIVAHDIEKAGQFSDNPIVSIGFCVGDEKGKVMLKQRFNNTVEWPTKHAVTDHIVSYNDFEKRCWDEFWSKLDKNILMDCLENPEHDIRYKVKEFLNKLEHTYPEPIFEIRFVSDHPSFDTAAINHLLGTSIQYSCAGTYRSVCTADDMFDMIPYQQRAVYRTIDFNKYDNSILCEAFYLIVDTALGRTWVFKMHIHR